MRRRSEGCCKLSHQVAHPNVKLVEVADGHELGNTIPTLIAESDKFLAPFLK